jgi:hypothetical protein
MLATQRRLIVVCHEMRALPSLRALQALQDSVMALAAGALSPPGSELAAAVLHVALTPPPEHAGSPLACAALRRVLSAISPVDAPAASAALAALQRAAATAQALLLHHAPLLSDLLDALPALPTPHVHAAARLLAALLLSEAGGAEESAAAPPLAAAVQERYTQLLASAAPRARHVAIIGTLHWAAALAGRGGDAALAGRAKLEDMLALLQKDPRLLGALYDMFADHLLDCIRCGDPVQPVRAAAPCTTPSTRAAHACMCCTHAG